MTLCHKAYAHLAAVYDRTGATEKALSTCRSAIARGFGSTAIHYRLARIYLRGGSWGDAVAEIRQGTKALPTAVRQGAFRIATEEGFGRTAIHYRLACIYLKRHSWDDAVAELWEGTKALARSIKRIYCRTFKLGICVRTRKDRPPGQAGWPSIEGE